MQYRSGDSSPLFIILHGREKTRSTAEIIRAETVARPRKSSYFFHISLLVECTLNMCMNKEISSAIAGFMAKMSLTTHRSLCSVEFVDFLPPFLLWQT